MGHGAGTEATEAGGKAEQGEEREKTRPPAAHTQSPKLCVGEQAARPKEASTGPGVATPGQEEGEDPSRRKWNC